MKMQSLSPAQYEGIIAPDLFERVNRKLNPAGRKKRRVTNDRYPLSGLLVCGHCTQNMVASTTYQKNKNGEKLHQYERYVCSTFTYYGRGPLNVTDCGFHSLRAEPVLAWLVSKLQKLYLAPRPDALVKKLATKLKHDAQPENVKRLRKQAAELEEQAKRLAMAIRATGGEELVEEYRTVKAERETVQSELRELVDPAAIEAQAKKMVDEFRESVRDLTHPDPAKVREALRQFVDKIECRWGRNPGKHTFYPLQEGRVFLRKTANFALYREIFQESGTRSTRSTATRASSSSTSRISSTIASGHSSR